MKDCSDDVFNSITHGVLKTEQVVNEIKKFLEEDSSAQYSIVIGADSHEKIGPNKSYRSINLVTALLVHRKGFGGKYFWQKKDVHKIHSLREKIYAETISSLEFATRFVPILQKNLNGNLPKYNLEIHIDVGEHGNSREMIKEVVGMVTGNGFIAKTKPEAYGASYVADKHT